MYEHLTNPQIIFFVKALIPFILILTPIILIGNYIEKKIKNRKKKNKKDNTIIY